ncbi:helix-turn-helix transcriptional regulator [Mangrovibacterium diazotrophicum]|uniref:Putative DNA-binding transcriptional regulator YafY n=1 Tax=Mangrovibacterium diazotrophicum TaxID=1261403 RepID=A0A419W3K2_9BACT|nr:WYL domain-containing protein [Mangrovibacterium diazotrophicum]RKD90019.1 putative DNA-binding transcriptional regulator YafY [Mangrovibacterium diazotrophicum]
MSDRKTVLRYFHVLNRLRKSPASFKEIDAYLNQQSEWQDENFQVSKRQFGRILKDIKSIFELDIDYDVSRDVYFIDEESESDITNRRLEALDTFQALKVGTDISKIIHFEQRHPQGSEYLMPLIQAIKKEVRVQFAYQKFWDNFLTTRMVEPYALKEFKNRWYLVAKDKKDDKIKTFGLDRLSNLILSNTKFAVPETFSVDKYFHHCFGIITPDEGEPEEIVICFPPHQGKYVKTMPLHGSQEVLTDDETELRIRLKIHRTYDFLLEILSHGDDIKVISPPELVLQVTDKYKNALNQYPNEKTN